MTKTYQRLQGHSGPRPLLGLTTGLKDGENVISVRAGTWHRGDDSARLKLTNWPITGPIFSGPHQRPYFCMTHLFNLPVTGGNLEPPWMRTARSRRA